MLYSLVGDNIPFSVAMDGFMRVSGAVDYETNRRFLFQIRATNPIPVSASYAVVVVVVVVVVVYLSLAAGGRDRRQLRGRQCVGGGDRCE